jgi:HK97 family phage prohead protease
VSAGTLELEDRDLGLWGRIKINPKDSQAMDAYERIARKDIQGCSFGFNVEKESTEVRDDGSVHWTIEKVNPLFEVSPCVFPAYQSTSIEARKRDLDEIKKRQAEAWKKRMKERLQGHGTETVDAEEKD